MLSPLRTQVPTPVKKIYRDVRAKLLSIGLQGAAEFHQPIEEIQASKDFSIVMPVFDTPPLVRCLSSVEHYAPHAEVIMVDDGSRMVQTKNALLQFAKRNQWTIIRNEEPLGHSRATEAGARLAKRPYLCLLNSDTVVTPWSWRSAQEAFEADEKIAITGPTTSHASTCQVVKRAEICRNYWSDSQVLAFAQKYVSSQPPRSWIDLPDVGGFALFIRRDIWEDCGGFDPNLPHYGNEVELCKRIIKKGFRIVWTRNSYIHHLGGQSYSNAAYGAEFISANSESAQEYINRKYS